MTGIETRLPAFLPGQRWYGEKASPMASIVIRDAALTGLVAHLIVDVRGEDGSVSTYYVPVVVRESGEVTDAARHPAFHSWIAAIADAPTGIAMEHGRMTWRGVSNQSAKINGPSRVLAVEQSNTSIRFGDAALVKLFRKLQPGVNPEIELTQFLTERTSFKNSPALLGTLTYAPNDGEPVALAVAQSFVPSISDGWTAMLSILADLQRAEDDESEVLTADSYGLVRQLGRRTAEFHLSLSSDLDAPELAPEAISERDIAAWKTGFVTLLDRVAASIERHEATGPETVELEKAFLESIPRLLDRVAGFDRLQGVAKIRVHGDYHLGQTLLTHEHDWFLLDFEGEPRRTLLERRAKTSPLKDVAGMLRSFSYARGTAAGLGGSVRGAADLIAWERGARSAFLDGYLGAARTGKAGFLPMADEDVRLAVGAWELDKAIYEIDYELNNRPTWLWLPLTAALKFI